MESKKQDKSAPDTTELGRAINKIRDGMADFETRILWCENMLTTSNAGLEFELSDTETVEALHILTRKDKQRVADIIFLANRLRSLEEKKTKKDTNYIYSSIKEEDTDEKLHSD